MVAGEAEDLVKGGVAMGVDDVFDVFGGHEVDELEHFGFDHLF